MPNQLAVVKVLTEDIVGPQTWDDRRREYTTMPTDAYWDAEDAAAAILEKVAQAVDWPRLLFEASHRHQVLHMDDTTDTERRAGEGTRYECKVSGVCGECLRHALLTEETGAHNWARTPDVPLSRGGVDWAGIVAATITHRREPQEGTKPR